MPDTTFFTQCEKCLNCTESSFGHFCEKHLIHIGNPKIDGCTWGNERDEDNG